jgi:1-acyl-sn-glycerol-3-phosphate acyltransferase
MQLPSADAIVIGETRESSAIEGTRSAGASTPEGAQSSPWRLSLRSVLTAPLPEAGFVDRLVQRGVALFALRQVTAIHGLENLTRAPEPVIVAINHSIRREALLVPALLVIARRGRWIHFLADWNFLLMPVIGWVMRRSGVIVVTRKSARPAFLNRLKPFFEDSLSTAERVKEHLAAGRSVGVFPEGTVNRDPGRLLPGRVGMSRLSLETGVPVVPVGIRFPDARPGEPIGEQERMEIHVGSAIQPPAVEGTPSLSQSRRWHGTVMHEIARLSGKSWGPKGRDGDENA